MHQPVDQIIELLKQWGDFAEDRSNPDMADFAAWLSEKTAREKASQQSGHQTTQLPRTSKETSIDGYINYMLGRLARFAILWSKKMFDDLPIRTMEEYGILKIAERHPNARKSEIAYESLLESTTCLEIIKRLRKMGLLTEEPDETDRRSRRVSLTADGQEVVQKCELQLNNFSRLIVGELSEEEKQSVAEAFGQLNEFHGKVYARHRDATLEQLVSIYLSDD